MMTTLAEPVGFQNQTENWYKKITKKFWVLVLVAGALVRLDEIGSAGGY